MDKESIFNYIIATLCTILIIMIIYIGYQHIKFKKNYIPHNSINVSPITGERLSDVYNNNELPVEVTYIDVYENGSISGISKADIVYEFLNEDYKVNYKAIFYNFFPSNNYPISSICKVQLEALPKFKFKDIIDVEKSSKDAQYIFANFNNLHSSNFVYKDGVYEHFLDTSPHIDNLNNEIVKSTNVIVQFVNNDSSGDTSGKGLLFLGGKVIEIEWKKDKGKIKLNDLNGNEISIIKGNTWWIITDKNNSIVYK
ncbi:DUF3048 C-terminal domain-containing protein [Clostridium sp. MSJ-4]|uniref:DUF3048 C-terminal domain-containing protein n=1 Tax=Clostridium simiarum TaxID=2841506 RepID=A0ABS6EZX1_9CLOT|nr:DUF3048 C-terminal domain-containing protein [Clostridium simiarum]MBU5591781.1 DUF3048 C-terminal domain-containing protein [Clostridium simiarum]